MPRLVTIGTLTVAQAALGWFMVVSGLSQRVNVSQYRLAAHLSLAVVIFLISVWTADSLLNGDGEPSAGGKRLTADDRTHRKALRGLLGLAFLTLVSGAFVAGLRAGAIYNEFPMMGAGLVPVEYSSMAPWWKNLFENPAAVQFNHRLLAITTLLAIGIFWFRSRAAASAALRTRLDLVFVAVLGQVALGITVLLLGVPVLVGVAHQAGAAGADGADALAPAGIEGVALKRVRHEEQEEQEQEQGDHPGTGDPTSPASRRTASAP